MPTALEQDGHGAQHALRVDAVMGVEILVFRRDEGLLDHLRNGGVRQEQPALVRIFGEDRAVAGVDARRDRRLVIAKLRRVGQVFFEDIDEACEPHRADEKQNRAGREDESEKPEDERHQSSPWPRSSRACVERARSIAQGSLGRLRRGRPLQLHFRRRLIKPKPAHGRLHPLILWFIRGEWDCARAAVAGTLLRALSRRWKDYCRTEPVTSGPKALRSRTWK